METMYQMAVRITEELFLAKKENLDLKTENEKLKKQLEELKND